MQLARRTADHAEHFRSGGLLLQGFAQFTAARLHLVEQANVLDGDHGLVSEGGYQLDLLIAEGPDGRPAQCKDTDRISITY